VQVDPFVQPVVVTATDVTVGVAGGVGVGVGVGVVGELPPQAEQSIATMISRFMAVKITASERVVCQTTAHNSTRDSLGCFCCGRAGRLSGASTVGSEDVLSSDPWRPGLSDDTTPDFDIIARQLAEKSYFTAGTASDFAAALKNVWNARGVADVKAINYRAATMPGSAISERDRQQLREAIKAVDR